MWDDVEVRCSDSKPIGTFRCLTWDVPTGIPTREALKLLCRVQPFFLNCQAVENGKNMKARDMMLSLGAFCGKLIGRI